MICRFVFGVDRFLCLLYTNSEKECMSHAERSDMMATQSILKNITITDLTDAEAFISAVKKAVQTAETSSPHIFESEKQIFWIW